MNQFKKKKNPENCICKVTVKSISYSEKKKNVFSNSSVNLPSFGISYQILKVLFTLPNRYKDTKLSTICATDARRKTNSRQEITKYF